MDQNPHLQLSEQQKSEFLAFAHDLAETAASCTLPLFRQPLDIKNKLESGFDPVTKADREAEAAIRQMIETRFPNHGIIGEEFGIKQGNTGAADGDFTWVLDPVDGTRAFISGLPTWGTLIALVKNDRAVLGLMDQPFTGERYAALAGEPAALNVNTKDRRLESVLQVRPCRDIAQATIATTSPHYFDNTPAAPIWAELQQQARLIGYGGDCYNYAQIATGQIDAVIEQGLKAYDILALIPIIEQAGGVCTDWRGNPVTLSGQAHQILACGDRDLHTALLEKLAPAAD